MMNFLRLFSLAVMTNIGMLAILNSKIGQHGEANGEGQGGNEGQGGETNSGGEKSFTQAQVNAMMAEHKRGLQTELEGTKNQLNELTGKLSKYQQEEENRSQQQMEAKQEYDKLKDSWGQKENEYKTLLSDKESRIKDMHVTNALTTEIIKLNAHSDAVQLVKSLATVDDNGSVFIKGKDANGMETNLPVGEGLKQFLESKPWLIKATGNGGAGTPPALNQGGNNNMGQNPNDLADQLAKARFSGDRKAVADIKQQIRNKHSNISL